MQDNEQSVEAIPQPFLDEPEVAPQEEAPSEQVPEQHPEGQQESEAIKPSDEADWYREDRKAFDEAYPDVDKEILFGKEDFIDFAEGKVGVMPMTEIYRRYLKWRGPSARELARKASPGALGKAQPPAEAEFYTLNEIRKLTPQDIDRDWDKVQRSLKRLSQ